MAKLPAEGTQARRFGKTRSEQSTALLEDYAELIADLLAGQRGGLRASLAFAGPAVVASIAYMDPGNFATNIQAGALQARYGLDRGGVGDAEAPGDIGRPGLALPGQ